MNKIAIKNRILASILALALVVTTFVGLGIDASAAPKTLSIEQAKALALADSDEYEEIKNEIALAQSQYAGSVKKIKLKQKNQKTFRWTPLLSFKFPEKPSESDEFEYTYKELELQDKIIQLGHKLNDKVFGVYEKVEQQFIKVYVLQEKIKYTTNQIELAKTTLSKNRAKLILGEATKKDIESMEKKLDTLQSQLETQTRNFEAEKGKLSNIINLKVQSGYTFKSPFVDTNLDRDLLEEIKDYTVENDHAFYEVAKEEELALLALNTNYRLMVSKYGNKVAILTPFINQAKNGQKLKTAAFKKIYNQFLKDIDEPWNGKKKILFFKFPKVWFKGAKDGVRYVEDEPYVLYENTVDYQSKLAAKVAAEKELRQSVTDNYNTYVAFKNTLINTKSDIVTSKNKIKEGLVKNSMGEMSYDDFATLVDEADELQVLLLDTYASLSEILYTINRQSCGFVQPKLKRINVSLSNSGTGGQSFVIDEGDALGEDASAYSGGNLVAQTEGEGIYYYIHQMVSKNMFEIGLSVSRDVDVRITDYELWVNNTQIGARTPIGTSIKHLYIDLSNTDDVFIRLYNGADFVDDCVIDPAVFSARLEIVTGYTFSKAEEDIIGYYTGELENATNLYEINIYPESQYSNIAGYNIETLQGVMLLDGEIVKIDNSFKHLMAISNSLDVLKINFYDESGALLFQGGFKQTDNSIRKIQ